MDDYLQSGNIVARLNLPNMQQLRERRVEVYLRAQEGLAELEPDPEKRLKYIDFIAQYANLSEAEQAEYERYLAQSTYREVIMGPVQKAREEGLREGFQQGRQEALREGLREGLLKAIQFGLELKFGVAGLTVLPEIQKIQELELLNNIQEALKIAKSTEELRLLWEQPTSH